MTKFAVTFLILALIAICSASSAIEQPSYSTLAQKSGYQIREYASSAPQYWTETVIEGSDWQTASTAGFWRLFQYISGQNSAQLKINMTAPVTMSHNATAFVMRFFVPAELGNSAPQPTSSDVSIVTESLDTVAVISFGGWATQSNSEEMTQKLMTLLQHDGVVVDSASPIRLAQYNSPYELKNRINEIWIPVTL